MNAHEQCMALLESQREIVEVLFSYIDRMYDTNDDDSLEKIGKEFLDEVDPVVRKHLRNVLRIKKVDS